MTVDQMNYSAKRSYELRSFGEFRNDTVPGLANRSTFLSDRRKRTLTGAFFHESVALKRWSSVNRISIGRNGYKRFTISALVVKLQLPLQIQGLFADLGRYQTIICRGEQKREHCLH